MKFFMTCLLLLSPFFTTLQAACEAPANLGDYQVISGDYNLSGQPNSVSPGIYVDGDVTIPWFYTFTGNIYATGNVSLGFLSSVNGSVYSESSISQFFFSSITGEECESVTPPVINYCELPPDVSNYTLVANLNVDKNTERPLPLSTTEDLYVTGGVSLGVNGIYNGNIYSVGDVFIGNNAVIHGDVYTQNGIIYDNHNSSIDGEICEGGDPVLPPDTLDLPVDELIGQCTDIFKDAVQSHMFGELTMYGASQIAQQDAGNRVTTFDFLTKNTHGTSCGTVACDVSGNASVALSDFSIPIISGDDITATAWADGVNIELGNSLSTTPKFRAVSYQNITISDGATVTFAEQDPADNIIYQIDNLTVNGGGTLKLNAGVYALRNLAGYQNSTIEVIGDSGVFLFVEGVGTIEFQGVITSQSQSFFLVTNSDITLNTNANFIGSLYSNGDIVLNGGITVTGKVAGKSITMSASSQIIDDLICASPPDDYQFEIITSPDALTCEAHPVRVNVKNSDGSMATDYTGLITLATASPLGTWSLLTGSGTLTDSGVINGQGSYQFASADLGTVELGLFNEIATDLSALVADGSVNSNLAVISFRPFQLKSEIPSFTTSNAPFNMTLTAVGKDPSGVGCDVIEQYTGNKNLKFWSSYIDPDPADILAPFGTSVEINQAIIAKNKTTATNQVITFNSGAATVSVNYPDAGQIQIHARDDDGIGAPPAASSENDELQGSTITIVNPLKLVISEVSGNPAESGGYNPVTGSGFQRAAVRSHTPLIDVDVFDITVKAVIDCSNDPMNHCSGNDNPKAPSFHNEGILLPTLVFPNHASASLGTVHSEDGANQLAKSMVAGELTYSDLSYDEVGVLGLQATSIDYIQASNNITASDVKEVGRFYPAYIAYDNYSYDASCNGFTYMTEGLVADIPFAQSAVSVNYAMQAKAQASNGEVEKTTLNYDSGVGYPIAPTVNFSDKAYSQKSLTDLSSRILPQSYYEQTQWLSGVYTITGLNMGLQKSLIKADGPYFLTMPSGVELDDQVEYFIKLAGIDGERLQTDVATVCTTDQCRLPADTSLSSFGDFAHGRLQAGNGHGSEFQPIRALIEATYFDGKQFVPFSRDSCTEIVNQQLSAIPVMNVSNEIAVGSGKSELSILNSPLISGKSYFEFSAPDDDGSLDYFIRLKDLVTVNLYAPWLLDSGNAVTCPDETGALQGCISGHVEFGLFRGNDRIIYRMQTFE